MITKEQIQKQITELVVLRGNYHFKLNSVILNTFKGVKLDGIDWTVINELYSALKGTDKRRLAEYITQYTPLNFNTKEGKFTKPKKAKWTDLNLMILASNSFENFVKAERETYVETPILSDDGSKQYDTNGDLLVKKEKVETPKTEYSLIKKGVSLVKHVSNQLDDFDNAGIINPLLRAKLVDFKIQAQLLADEMELARNTNTTS